MPNKVNPRFQCLLCRQYHSDVENKSSGVIQISKDSDDIEKKFLYTQCTKCLDAKGALIRVWRRSEHPDLGYFTRNRHKGIPVHGIEIPEQ